MARHKCYKVHCLVPTVTPYCITGLHGSTSSFGGPKFSHIFNIQAHFAVKMAGPGNIWNEPCERRTLEETPPEDVNEVQEFVRKYSLRHGDVLSYSDMRDMESYIVYQGPEGKFSILDNPDDSSSGYLTIPAEVLISCTNSYGKYKSIIDESAFINLKMSPSDTFLTEKFGDIPNSWKFDVHFTFGDLESIFVSVDNVEWHDVNIEGESVADIMPRLN